MQLKAFDSFHKGYSHVKTDKECEDYSISYNDPDNRYYIAAISDGHSDKNCFRSSKGSRFVCESAKEVLIRFCETYLESGMDFDNFRDEDKERLKKSIKQSWDNKVEQDLADCPITEEDLEPLSEKVKDYYSSGRALENIYGATFLAVAICKDLCILLHIGDGVILSISTKGEYEEPIINDPKSETGEPASICNNDLFSREFAFRCEFLKEIPQAVFLTSDGIGDSMDDLSIREFVYTLLTKFKEQSDDDRTDCLNEAQQTYLNSCVSYYADKGHGVEDDCSIGGIYTQDADIPLVSISIDESLSLFKQAIEEQNKLVEDYEKRKKDVIKDILQLEQTAEKCFTKNELNEWFASKSKVEELRQILNNIVKNEEEKQKALMQKIERCKTYVERAGGDADSIKLSQITTVDSNILKEDETFVSFKEAQLDLKKKKEEEDKASEELKSAKEERDKADLEYRLATRKVVEAENDEMRKKAEQDAVDSNAKRKMVAEKYEAQQRASDARRKASEKSQNVFASIFQSIQGGSGKKNKKD